MRWIFNFQFLYTVIYIKRIIIDTNKLHGQCRALYLVLHNLHGNRIIKVKFFRKYLPAGRRGRKVLPRPQVEGGCGQVVERGGAKDRKRVDRIPHSQWRKENHEMYRRFINHRLSNIYI